MTTRKEYEKLRDRLFSLFRKTLVDKFNVKNDDITTNAILSDLGLEPDAWYQLAAMVEQECNITFTDEDRSLFDLDNPTVMDCVQMTARRMNYSVPPGEDILSCIVLIIEEITGIDREDLTPDKHLVDDLNIDWVDIVSIANRCEDMFDMTIPDEAISCFSGIQELARYVSVSRFASTAA